MIIVTGLAFVLGLGLQIWLESGLGTELLVIRFRVRLRFALALVLGLYLV